MEGNELIVIENNELERLDQIYLEYSKKALIDPTYESDYQAALRAPAAFLKKPSNIENTFDKILFHLDEAYRKSSDDKMRLMISKTIDDIFHKLIGIIQAKIDYIQIENNKNLFQKITETFTNFFNNVRKNLFHGEPLAVFAESAAPEIGKLLGAFFDYLLINWELKRNITFFYNQLANIYQKILNSKAFSNQFGLIRNTFTTNKQNILAYVTQEKGLSAARILMKYDENESEKQDSARIILRTLTSMGEWEKGADLLSELRESKLPNYAEMRDEYLRAYKSFLEYLKNKEGKKDPRKEIKTRYPTAEAIEYLINADKPGYEKYRRKRTVRKFAVIFSILFVLITFLAFAASEGKKNEQQRKQYQTDNVSKLEDQWNEVERTASKVDALIKEKKYEEAIKLVNTGITFKDSSGFASNYASNANDLRHDKKVKCVEAILTEGNSCVSKEINDELYEYLTDKLIPLYNSTISTLNKDQIKSYKEKLKPVLNKLDTGRDTFLIKREKMINVLIEGRDYKKAEDLISRLVHKSNEKRNLLSKYDEYWSKKMNSLRKELPPM